MRVCVIFNPAARGDKARKLSGLLQEIARDCHCKPTAAVGDARRLAAQAAHEGFDTIVAAGGDGTINEVINGIGDVPEAFSRTRLGLLPLGTVNVLARELKIPFQPRRAWEIIRAGKESSLDLPKAEFQSSGQTVSRYFAQLAGAGLDSNAVAHVDWELKKKIGPLAYVAAGFKALRLPQAKIIATSDAGAATGELVLIGNGRFYGGNFLVFSKAEMRDGLIDVCVFQRANLRTVFAAALGLATKNIHRFCNAKEFQCRRVTLSADRQTFLQLDGESVGELPATLSVQRNILRMLVP